MNTSNHKPASSVPVQPGLRVLLGIVTALIVARPLVAGDDPGLLSPLSHPAGMALTLGWILALVVWASWRSLTVEGSWITSGGVDLALLALFGIFAIGAFTTAEYRQPAWLIAWEWFSYALAFFLVRQLARTPEDNHALLCALVACATCIAVQTIYQRAFELPALSRKLGQDPAAVARELPRQYSHVETDDAILITRVHAIQNERAAGTLVDPENLACFLALLLPGAIGLAVGAALDPKMRGRAVALGCCALAILLAIVCAGSWSAILALTITGLVLAWLLPARPIPRLALASVCLATAVVVFVLYPAGHQLGVASRFWEATWRVTERSPWLGLGAGNLGRHIASVVQPTSLPHAEFPGNIVLEILSSAGVVGTLLIICVGVLAGRMILHSWRARAADTAPLSPTRVERWEFILGGIAGLLMAFLLRVPMLSSAAILREGWMCGLRAIVWIVVFALCFATGTTQRLLSTCCVIGIAVAVLQLTVAGSISNPALGQPLFVMLAVALNTALPREGWRDWRGRVAVGLPVPISLAVLFTYVAFAFFPQIRAATLVTEARRYGEAWQADIAPTLRTAEGSGGQDDRDKLLQARTNLERHIIVPLQDAGRANSGDAYIAAELAHWLQIRLELTDDSPHTGDAKKFYNLARDATGSPLGSAHHVDGAQALDPRGLEGYLAEFHLHAAAAVILEKVARQYSADATKARDDAKNTRGSAEQATLQKRAKDLDSEADEEHNRARRELDYGAAALERMVVAHPREQERAKLLVEQARDAVERVRSGKNP